MLPPAATKCASSVNGESKVPVPTAVPKAEGRITTDSRQKCREGPSMMFVIP
jgi:hypothetical protein